MLQWGREPEPAEIPNGAGAAKPLGVGFNGAASRSPRKSVNPRRNNSMVSSFNGAASRSPRKFAHEKEDVCAAE